MKKHLRSIFLVFGVILFYLLIQKIGIEKIVYQILSVKEAFLFSLLIALAWHVLYAISWGISLGSESKNISINKLFKARLAGESMNGLTPFVGMGGEPVKIHLIGQSVTMEGAIGSVMIEKTMFITTGIVVMTLGTILAMLFVTTDSFTRLFLATASMAGLTLLGSAFTHRGAKVTTALTDTLKSFGIHPNWLEKSENFLHKLDTFIVSFYTSRPVAFAVSLIINCIARLLGVIEMYIILHALGADLNWIQVFYIWSLTNFFSQIFSFIPSSIGASEGAQAFLLLTLGKDPMLGLVLALVRRARQIIFLGLGLYFLGFWKTAQIKAQHQ